jgi:Spy/CpxP family protein refolding chaperone
MTEWLNARSKPRAVASMLLIMTFLVGALAGAALNQVLNARQPAEPQQATRPDVRRDGGREHAERTPYDDLDLTAAQRAQVNALLAERRRRIDSIWDRSEPVMRAIMASSKNEIEALLTEEQRALLEQRRAERRERRATEAEHRTRGNR